MGALALAGAWLFVGGSSAVPTDHGPELWAGQWTTSTGGVAWRAFNDQDLEIAKTGKDAKELFDKLPCKNGPRFYRGGYSAGADRGKIMGCGTPTNMRGRWLSNVGGGFQNGSYVIHISSQDPLKFTGTYRQDDGVTGKYTGTWSSHFGGDGCCAEQPPSCKKPRMRLPSGVSSEVGAAAEADVPNVKIAKEAAARYPNLEKVLKQLWRTLNNQSLWGKLWNENVSLSGCITTLGRYKFSAIAAALRGYLSDGTVTIEYRIQAKARAAAQTVDRNRIILFQAAGRESEHAAKEIYSDYFLARTLFHELMHVFQYDKWNPVSRKTDYEGFPTALDPSLPKAFFSTQIYQDPGSSNTPLPPPKK